MSFNDESFIKEFADFVSTLNIESAFEVGCSSGELTNALKEMGIQTSGIDLEPQHEDVIKGDILTINPKGKKKYDLVFSSGLLEHSPIDTIPDVIKKILAFSKKYVLNYVPHSECLAYQNAKTKTTAEWKDELCFIESELCTLHEKAGLEVLKSGFAGSEWSKKFGPEPSLPYLVYVLAKKPDKEV